jgi:transcriptional regulator
MIHYPEYSDVPPEAVDAFVHETELARLVTVADDGTPHIGLYPFVYDGERVELHLHRADEQLADVAARPRCVFEVSDPLAVVPSYWLDPENAVMATAYHRTVVFACDAAVSFDPDALAAQQARLMARYQPEGGFRELAARDPLYAGNLGRIAAVTLLVRERRIKWKLGQNRGPDVRAKVAEALRERGRPGDARAAAWLAWTLDRPKTPEPSKV